MSQAVKELFTAISPTYDKLNHFLSLNIDKSWRRKAIAKIQKEPEEMFLALDLCAGTHDLGLECLRQFPRAQIMAADFSLGMLKQGQAKIAAVKDAIFPVCCDVLNLPFADESFDVVICAYGVRNLDDKAKGLAEIRRVLKPHGQVIILEFFRPASLLSRIFNKTYAGHILPRLGKWISGNPSAYKYLRDSIRGFMTVHEFTALTEKSGFENVGRQDFFMAISSCVWAEKDKA